MINNFISSLPVYLNYEFSPSKDNDEERLVLQRVDTGNRFHYTRWCNHPLIVPPTSFFRGRYCADSRFVNQINPQKSGRVGFDGIYSL